MCWDYTWMVSGCEELVGAITGDEGVCFYEVSFFKRIGEARAKLMGIEENVIWTGEQMYGKFMVQDLWEWLTKEWLTNAYK